MGSRECGIAAESLVLKLLLQRGWRLLDRNWSCRWGELDLVLVKQHRLLVVEVKGRRSPARALQSVLAAKRRRMGRAISCWRALHPIQSSCLLEVAVAVVPLPPSRGSVRWILLDRLC